MPNPNGNPQYLKSWVKGQTGNAKGRPRKLASDLRIQFGYSKSQINTTIANMMAMTREELQQVYADEDATILERTVANALNKGLVKGSLYAIDSLTTRVYGQPKIEVEQTQPETPIFVGIDLSVKSNEGI
jgi:hypothetical protein